MHTVHIDLGGDLAAVHDWLDNAVAALRLPDRKTPGEQRLGVWFSQAEAEAGVVHVALTYAAEDAPWVDDLVRRMRASWPEPTVWAAQGVGDRVEDLDVLCMGVAILEHFKDYAPSAIQPQWVRNKVPGLDKKTSERRIRDFLRNVGIATDKGQWRPFVAYVRRHPERFTKPAS
jgi:hypothetical protein